MEKYKGKRLKRIRIPTDQEIIDMLHREDYYKLLKIRAHPEDRRAIIWNVMRTKWSILNQMDKL